MNAYELANYWMNRKFAIEMADETCDLLRQQADRIAELKEQIKENDVCLKILMQRLDDGN